MPLGAPNYRRGPALGGRGVPRAGEACCRRRGTQTNVGDEGGFAPSLGGNEPAIEVILEAIAPRATSRAGRGDRARPGGERALRQKQERYVLPKEGSAR